MKDEIKMTHTQYTLVADAGRIKVAYFERKQCIRIIRSVDGEILKEIPFPDEHDFAWHGNRFDLTEFIEIVKRYRKICNHK